MIGSLSGVLTHKAVDGILVDVGGVGYRLTVSLETYSRLPLPGEKVSLLVHTWVREDEISLYGFASPEEKRLFLKLLTVSGVGARLALTILSGIPPQELVQALQAHDLPRLTTIPGIGKKTAERMILELKDKLKDFPSTGGMARTRPGDEKGRLYDDILSVLINLGYNRTVAERTVARLDLGDGASLENQVKKALRVLAENRS